MNRQRQVVIVSENSYYRAVFRETLIEAGFLVDDQATTTNLEEILRGAPDTNLLLLDQDLSDTTAEHLLRKVIDSGAVSPDLRSVCLVSRPMGAGEQVKLKSAGFAGAIPLHATPEQIIFRVNDLIFSEAAKQRKNLRAPVSLPAQVIMEDKLFDGMVVSLSKHGLYLKSSRTLPVNSVINLKFNLPPSSLVGNISVEVIGRVTLVKGRTGPGDIYFGPGMVVIFENPEPSLQNLLDEFVAGELETLQE